MIEGVVGAKKKAFEIVRMELEMVKILFCHLIYCQSGHSVTKRGKCGHSTLYVPLLVPCLRATSGVPEVLPRL